MASVACTGDPIIALCEAVQDADGTARGSSRWKRTLPVTISLSSCTRKPSETGQWAGGPDRLRRDHHRESDLLWRYGDLGRCGDGGDLHGSALQAHRTSRSQGGNVSLGLECDPSLINTTTVLAYDVGAVDWRPNDDHLSPTASASRATSASGLCRRSEGRSAFRPRWCAARRGASMPGKALFTTSLAQSKRRSAPLMGVLEEQLSAVPVVRIDDGDDRAAGVGQAREQLVFNVPEGSTLDLPPIVSLIVPERIHLLIEHEVLGEILVDEGDVVVEGANLEDLLAPEPRTAVPVAPEAPSPHTRPIPCQTVLGSSVLRCA